MLHKLGLIFYVIVAWGNNLAIKDRMYLKENLILIFLGFLPGIIRLFTEF